MSKKNPAHIHGLIRMPLLDGSVFTGALARPTLPDTTATRGAIR